ncbi:MAG: hypothetical protein IIA85_00450 [Nanoarchaeota archaeon]|nr:hypothetical protein [Nanoarchaeota archaeon]
MNLEDFDSIVVGTYKGDMDFYYKLIVLNMEPDKNEMFQRITRIDDSEFNYYLFAQTNDFLSLEKFDLDGFEGGLVFSIYPLRKWPGSILYRENSGNLVKMSNSDLELPEVVFLRGGRIYVHDGLMKLPEYMVRVPEIMRNVGEIFEKGNSLDLQIFN